MNTDYYVYERFRKDDNTCFYVGQGRKKRYSTFTRNKLHDAIATKCSNLVMRSKQGKTYRGYKIIVI